MLLGSKSGFTLPELLAGLGVASLVGSGLLVFGAISTRMVGRNLVVNHSNETVRIANARLSNDLHGAFSNFRLVDCADATTLSDVSPVATTDTDPLTGAKLTTHSNGVRFRMLAGGPFQLAANADSSATSLTFTMSGASSSYNPIAGDKIHIPLIGQELEISAVTSAPAGTPKTFTVTTTSPINFTFNQTDKTVTTAYFLRKVAYSVYNSKLRFHQRVPAASAADIIEVRDGVTNPKPFAFLSGTSISETKLRVSLESYDSLYRGQLFTSGTVTLQTMLSSRNSSNMFVQTN